MKMKMDVYNEKVVLNAIYLLEALVATRLVDLMSYVIPLRKKYGISDRETIVAHEHPKEFQNIEQEAIQQSKSFEKANPEAFLALFRETNQVKKAFGLGKEWHPILTRFVLTGVLIPVRFNAHAQVNEEEKTITFEVHKNTTLDDLIFAWRCHKSDRERLFGKAKSTLHSRQDIKDLAPWKYAMAVKINEGCSDKITMSVVNNDLSDKNIDHISYEEMGILDKKSADLLKQKRRRLKNTVTK